MAEGERLELHASNPSSGAYGIPQALPGTKMATVGSDWRTNPATQIKWGLHVHPGLLRLAVRRLGHSQATAGTESDPLARPGRLPDQGAGRVIASTSSASSSCSTVSSPRST